MADRCVDCGDRPRLELGSSFAETYAVKGPGGAKVHLTLRLCLRCGARFSDRTQLREYLRTRLPEYAARVQGVPAAN